MKHCLLLLGMVAVLAMGAPAYSQNIFMDMNGDGVCNTSDVLTSSTTSVDVWLDTNHNQAGTTVFCSDGINPLDMYSYGVILSAGGSGSVTYGTWTNVLSLWTVLDAYRTSGSYASVTYTAPSGTVLTAGAYKLGSIGITVTGNPTLSFLQNNSLLGGLGAPVTGFGSDCSGTDFPNTIALGTDFFESCGTASATPTQSTTWGFIKNLYR